MTAIVVRAAHVGDLDALVALNAQVQALHAQLEPAHFRADADAAETRSLLSEVLARDGHFVLLALAEGQASGYLWFEIQQRPRTAFAQARRRIYVHHVGVDAKARRRGVARALMRRVEAEARESGVDRVALDCWSANRDAQAFFRALGYAPFNVALGKSVGVGGA